MANVSFWLGTWVSSSEFDEMAPGDVHAWVMWGFGYATALTITAHPLQGGEEHFLAVENVRIQADATGRRAYFSVRNAGVSDIPGYGIAYGWISG